MRKSALILCLLGSAALPAWSASLADCFQDALHQSEALASRGEDLHQAEARYRQALAGVLPSLSLGYSYLRQDDHAAMSGSNPADQSTLKLALAQPLFRGFREFQALDQVKASIAAIEEARRWASMQLYLDVANAYFLVLSLERDHDLALEQMQLFGARVKDLQDRKSIGRSRDSEVLTVQAARASLSATVAVLDSQAGSARELLAFLTGKDAARPLDAVEAFPSEAGDLDARLRASQSRPDLVAGGKRVEAARKGLAIARGGHWPSADLLGNWYFQRPGAAKDIQWDLAFVATLPLFQGFSVPAKADEAESQLRQAELDLARQRRQVASDLRGAWTALRGDLAQVAALQEAYELSEKSYQALKRDYNLGLSTNLDVVQALSSSRDTQRALERARAAARHDFEKLEALSGARLNLLGAP